MLEVINISAGYKPGVAILQEFSLSMVSGDRIGVVGQNGSGKSTLVKALMGLTPWVKGSVIFEGQDLLKMAAFQRNKLGIAYFMQGGRVFKQLSVEENLKIATTSTKYFNIDKEFNKLGLNNLSGLNLLKRKKIQAGNLSGGERHLLAFLMTFFSSPNLKLLIADEPSAGVAQVTQLSILKVLEQTVLKNNVSILMIEQNITFLNVLTNKVINIKSDKI